MLNSIRPINNPIPVVYLLCCFQLKHVAKFYLKEKLFDLFGGVDNSCGRKLTGRKVHGGNFRTENLVVESIGAEFTGHH